MVGGEQPRSGASVEPKTREWRVGDSVFRIIKIKKKVEICTRHVAQVLLRGEHVVMVSPEGATSDSAVSAPVTSE